MTLGPWLGGLTNSTFVDVAAAPPTIEEEGPCGQISVKQIMVRYAPRLDEHWSLGLAVEIPKNTFTTNSHNERIAQRALRARDAPIFDGELRIRRRYRRVRSGASLRGHIPPLPCVDRLRTRDDRTITTSRRSLLRFAF